MQLLTWLIDGVVRLNRKLKPDRCSLIVASMSLPFPTNENRNFLPGVNKSYDLVWLDVPW